MVPATRARSKRQRGIKVERSDRIPTALRRDRHHQALDLARLDLHPHRERQEARPATAARLKGTGVVGGFPDLMFFGIKGEVCCVELNAEGGRLSES